MCEEEEKQEESKAPTSEMGTGVIFFRSVFDWGIPEFMSSQFCGLVSVLSEERYEQSKVQV